MFHSVLNVLDRVYRRAHETETPGYRFYVNCFLPYRVLSFHLRSVSLARGWMFSSGALREWMFCFQLVFWIHWPCSNIRMHHHSIHLDLLYTFICPYIWICVCARWKYAQFKLRTQSHQFDSQTGRMVRQSRIWHGRFGSKLCTHRTIHWLIDGYQQNAIITYQDLIIHLSQNTYNLPRFISVT